MPTQSTTYNSRVTDEALEKRFRDTFRSQGGAELVDDLYAQGVIVPVVDFTQAATGNVLGTNLQTAWDYSTGFTQVTSTSAANIIITAGFWQVDLTCTYYTTNVAINNWFLALSDGVSQKKIWQISAANATTQQNIAAVEDKFVVFLRANDVLTAQVADARFPINMWYRQIADVSGNIVNPTGFTSS